jgi:FMN-dependent oxidoreductase (nitrilotriacetate monooxygenase family)
MDRARQMKFGTVLHGVGRTWNDWRHPDRGIDASTRFADYARQTLAAERGKFDFVFVADSLYITPKSSPHMLNRLEPITLLSALATVTSRIGLVGTLSVTYSEPFNVARQFASLDHISGGRAGWNVVTSYLEDSCFNFSRTEHPAHNQRYRLAAEYLDVVQGLWDSWEDGAHVGDKESGVFLDPARLHRLDHTGEFFQVRGPLNLKRTPQGQPVIFQAGGSDDGRNFAAQRADAIFAPAGALDKVRDYYRDVKARIAGFGRDPALVAIMPDTNPIVGSTDAEAEAQYRELAALESLETGYGALAGAFGGHDFRPYDIDAPFPDVTAFASSSTAQRFMAEAQAERLTLRQMMQRLATPRSQFIGSPERIADEMQRWFEAGACDGFVILEPLPGQLQLFVEHVVPLLQARGLFRRDYEGVTFRDSLGIPPPPNRYTEAGPGP